KASRPANDRSMAVGCIADVAGELGEAMAPYVDTLLPCLVLPCTGTTLTSCWRCTLSSQRTRMTT
ncbi:unnamed protein product, partial [Closterium sp. NIES-54]